jgi:putative DNA primase/helicase
VSALNHVARIKDQLGPCVLLAIPPGEKGPRTREWQKLTLADMTPGYFAGLNHGQNIGVLLGAASEGLCTIDVDDDGLLEAFLNLNPSLRESLISKGARGGNIWLRIRGLYPPGGKIRTLQSAGFGEWRANGNQTVIYGRHPSGRDYSNNGNRPLEIEFTEIVWPAGLCLPWRRAEPEPMNVEAVSVPETTDLGRAIQFVERFKQDIKYVHEWKRWLVFEGGRWNAESNGAVHRLAAGLCHEMVAEALNVLGRDERESALRAAMAWGCIRTVDRMLEAARNDLRIIVSPEELDADPWLVGARNGVVDLRTGEITEHSRERLVTKFVGADFDPQATCPRWEQFNCEIFPDESVRRFIWKAAGYSLTGHTTEHHFIFLHGRGANGKSTFLEVIFTAFGDYAGRAGARLLYATDHHGTPDDQVAELFGRRLVIANETQEGARLNEGTLKDITGGDTLRGCRKYEHGFSFKSTAKIWLAGNHKPSIRGTDDGIWRRVRLIPFERQFGPGEREENLRSKLMSESPGIVNWLVQGCLLWQQEGLNPPEIVRAAVDEYRTEEDILRDFIAEHIEYDPFASAMHVKVFARYQNWSRSEGISFALSSRGLAKRLRERGFREGKDGQGDRTWVGLSLKGDG